MPPARNNSRNSPVDALSDVVALVSDKRQETLGHMMAVHESTSTWLQESIQSYKRKLGHFNPDAAVVDAMKIDSEPMQESKSKKLKSSASVMVVEKENVAANSVPAAPMVVAATVPQKKTIAPAASIVSKSEPAVVATSTSASNHGSHPQYLSVMSKKVTELRKELKALGLEATGLKKDLQRRLLDAMIESENSDSNNDGDEKEEVEMDVERASSGSSGSNKSKRLPTKSPFSKVDDDDELEEEDFEEDDSMSVDPVTESTNDSMSVDAPPSVEVIASKPVIPKQPTAAPVQKSFVKSTAALFSPNKLTSKFQQPRSHDVGVASQPQKKQQKAMSPFACFKKNIVKTASTLLSSSSKVHASAIDDESSTLAHTGSVVPVITASVDEDEQMSVSKMIASSNAKSGKTKSVVSSNKSSGSAKTAGSHSGGKSTSSAATAMDATLKSGVSNSIKEKQKLLAEARKQRLAEMRGKSKPVALGASATANGKAPQSGNTEDKRTALNAKMREKHAALKSQPGSQKSFATTSSSTSATATAISSAPKFSAAKPFANKSSGLSSSNVMQKQQPQQQLSVSKSKLVVEAQLRSPMETYEISDREESDSDESDCSDAAPRKNVPKWAQKENLLVALKDQYIGSRVDPDALFPEVETCDLEAIFDKKRSRYTKRSSSGNWTKDRVTAAEKLTYKRTMGYSSKTKL